MVRILRFLRWIGLGLLALGIGPVILTASAWIYFTFSGRVMPHVEVGGVPVEGLTLSEVEATLDRLWNREYRMTAVDLHDPSRAWIVAPEDFGLEVDATASAKLAVDLLHSGDPLNRVLKMLRVLRSGMNLQPVINFDPSRAQVGFSAWEETLSQPARDADVSLEEGRVIIKEAEPGWRLDALASIELIAKDPENILLESRMIPFVMQPVAAARTDISDVISRIDQVLQANPVLQAYDPVTDEHFNWSPIPSGLMNWLLLTDEGSTISVDIDPEAVEVFVRLALDELGPDRGLDIARGCDSILAQVSGGTGEVLIIEYRPTTYQVQVGDQWISLSFKIGMPYWKLQEVNPTLARRGLIPGETLILPPRDDMLTLPVVPNKRIVVDISEQRMRVFQDGGMIREHVISTGISDSPTMPGIFQVSSHVLNAYASIWNLYMPNFMGIYDAVPGLTNGIHGLPLLSNGRRLWADVLGRPASFGCIIPDLQAAEELYNWAEDGVVVEIKA